MSTTTFVKDPEAVLDYAVDWSKWLREGETIAASSVTATSGITVDSDTHTDTLVTVWLSGGELGVRYEVTNRITTSQGRSDDRTFRVDVAQR